MPAKPTQICNLPQKRLRSHGDRRTRTGLAMAKDSDRAVDLTAGALEACRHRQASTCCDVFCSSAWVSDLANRKCDQRVSGAKGAETGRLYSRSGSARSKDRWSSRRALSSGRLGIVRCRWEVCGATRSELQERADEPVMECLKMLGHVRGQVSTAVESSVSTSSTKRRRARAR